MRRAIRNRFCVLLPMLLVLLLVTGCGSAPASAPGMPAAGDGVAAASTAAGAVPAASADAGAAQSMPEEAGAAASAEQNAPDADIQDAPDAEAPAEDGTYTSKDEVALYLYTYHHLPPNYITKKEARKLGWEGGPLQDFAPGKSIGGDHFGNYEGVLPEDAEYHECDIDTNGGSRGAKRLVWSDDWNIYYTDDHYGHFTQLYNADGPVSP